MVAHRDLEKQLGKMVAIHPFLSLSLSMLYWIKFSFWFFFSHLSYSLVSSKSVKISLIWENIRGPRWCFDCWWFLNEEQTSMWKIIIWRDKNMLDVIWRFLPFFFFPSSWRFRLYLYKFFLLSILFAWKISMLFWLCKYGFTFVPLKQILVPRISTVYLFQS